MDGDYTITNKGPSKTGTVFERGSNLVIVHDGRRGPAGPAGPQGPKGDPGKSINIYDQWYLGQVYCPGDAVSDRSTLVEGIDSLYIQKTAYPCAPLLEAPHENPARWVEVGPQDWDNMFGGIWEVYQINHGFTKVGQPVGYSYQADRYTLATASTEDELGIAVVREVIDADRVVLQSSGEVPNIDPEVIYPDGSDWEPGRIYYVSLSRGRVELQAPLDNSAFVNPILMPSDIWAPGGGVTGRNGIALPWTPVSGRPKEYIPVGAKKFYFIATPGQTEISGNDLNGVGMVYIPGSNTEVFLDGLNLFETEYEAVDGYRITLDTPLAGGETIEVWTPDRPLDILVRSTTLKLDNIEVHFDGVETLFNLTYNSLPVVFQDASSVNIWLDATAQEPLVDYQLVDNGGLFAVDFREPPENGTRFWGIALSPSGQAGVPAGGATGAVLTKLSPADGDMYWSVEIFGGTF